MAVTIAIESPLQDDVRALVNALDAHLFAFCEPPHYHMTPEEMATPDTTVFVARDEGVAVACGALRRHSHGIGEVKRMYTIPSSQGRGIGGDILHEIELLARSERLNRLVLETGYQHAAAWRVYSRSGFLKCGPVLDYPDVSSSAFFEKKLETTEPVQR